MTAGSRRRVKHSPSIRRLLAGLLGVVAVLVASLLLVTWLQLRGSNHQATVENRRTESFLVADSMRQSSNDLTQMVRLYVSTGDSRYREFYEEILAIRDGTAPRPVGYDSSFWDRVLADGIASVEYGPPESLVDQMRAADFTASEFDALNASLRASDGLARLEVDVMDRVARRVADGVDETYAADVAREYQRLVDDAYLDEKGEIMSAVRRFIDLVDERTLADVDEARRDSRVLFAVQIGVLSVIVLVNAAAFALTKRLALRPLDVLTGATRDIADGNYAERVEVKGVAELERVADAFNAMATAVEADVAAREHAEGLAVEARQAAEAANQAKSSFLAAMSHEIRTPMIGVTGMLEVLAQSDLTARQRQMVGTAQSSATALLQIIGDSLDFSKIEAGKLDVVPTTFDVRSVVDAAVATFIHTASAKGLRLVSSCVEALAPAHVGDPLRVRQILSNFLSNAVKFTDVGGIEVRVSVVDQPSDDVQTVEFAVVDTGIGLTGAQQHRLFEEFVQADPSTTRRFGGTGLGLVICRRLAVLMGGEVSMSSEEGCGTSIRLVLPLPIGDPSSVVPEPTFTSTRFVAGRPTPSREEAIRERSLVLLAEDHSVNRAVLLHQLDAVGFCADAADDGQEALELFRTGRYAMVLTDVHMPRLDGYGLAEAIRRHEAEVGAPRTPIMALTANVMQGEPQRCRAAGMDDFAAKPITIPLLAAKLLEWLPHLGVPAPTVEEAEGARSDGGAGRALDATMLDELTGGDGALAAAILRDFVASSTADLQRLGEALDEGDLEEVRRQAHRVKGACGVVGATQLAQVAARIESAAGDGGVDAEDLPALRTEAVEALAGIVGQVGVGPADVGGS
jgi:signal transduction histidine kinase/HPt (histidine-containing phosphotransfer) domain-containing protein/FixJ family two-component response regulator